MKFVSIDKDPYQPGAMRVLGTFPDWGYPEDKVMAFVQDGELWREEELGTPLNSHRSDFLTQAVWAWRRKQRKEQQDRLVLTDAGRVVAESADNGASWNETAKRMQSSGALPVLETLTNTHGARGGVSTEAMRFTSMPRPHAGGPLTPEEFAQGAEKVRSGEAVVLNRKAIETGAVTEAWDKRDPRWVPMHKAVTAYVVNALEVLQIHDSRLGSPPVLHLEGGQYFAYLSPEASTEALRGLAMAIGAELTRRAEEER